MEHTRALVALTMFLLSYATDSAGDFTAVSKLRRNSQVTGGLCAHLIEPAGFPCTEHSTETKDGYLLGLQRVSSRSTIVRGEMGPPVLLIHGLFMAGDAWFMNSASESLGFILAEQGFDVWVGNVRGTRWSHGHVSLSVKNKEFWDWSWEELALYDLAEMIRYVNSITKAKILVVGHSQGTIMSLAAFTKPDIVEMVKAAALLCPISYLDHITTNFVLRLVKMRLDEIILGLGIHELNFKSNMGTQIMDMMCEGHIHCDIWLSAITGKNCCFNDSRIDFYLEYEPHPSSSKNLHHLFQMIRKGNFAMYDYGMWKNLMHYKQPEPPEFDISQIPTSLPLWMGYGGNDALADVIDVQHTLKQLKRKPDLLYIEEYGHIDFLLSIRAKEDVYDDMIMFFNSVQKISSFK
ncbi:PREDICTED: triacylglycerol lipase 1 isoform X1 [Nicotiana attenuata]|uniref:Lipase n=2 Tax=Nicotiana attenuata TaxID=49451 RepID=A0A1J6KDY0_NICAT|nr:PREDICTED: triacylglycerol lipase 1 isoform X1 [Nicotiana attenuata]OIT26900.1 triacylglycerol lipase 1 [Nicotiana attenuata]